MGGCRRFGGPRPLAMGRCAVAVVCRAGVLDPHLPGRPLLRQARRDDRAHYRRAWEVLALAVFAKAAWETVALMAPQPWSASVWGQALQAGLAGLGFNALAVGFYVFSFMAVGQEQSTAHRSPLRVDILLVATGLASITVVTVPVLRSIPGSGEWLAAAIGGLICVGALMALLIAGRRAPDFELISAWTALKIAAGIEAVRALLLSLPLEGVQALPVDWLVGPLGLASVASLAAVGFAAVGHRPPPILRLSSETLRPSVAAPAFATACLVVAALLQIIAPDLLGAAPSATGWPAATLQGFLLGFLALLLLRVYTDQWRSVRDMGQLRTKTVELEILLDNINDAVATQNFDGRVVFANRAFRDLFGLRPESPHLPPLDSLVHPDDAELWQEFCSRSLMGKRGAGCLRHRGVRADGIALELETSITPLLSGGIAWGVQYVIRDVARQRLIEKSQRAMAQRLEFFVREMPLGCVIWDHNFAVQEWNESAQRIFGWSGPEVLHRRYADFLVPPDGRAAAEELWRTLCTGHAASHGVCENQTKQSGVVECEWFHTSLIDDTGRVVAVASMVHDLTERKNLERQLLQSQKMEAVGTLAGGIAHDFNNLLTTILGHVSLALMKLGPSHSTTPGLTDVQTAAERGADLVGQLLRFSRHAPTKLKPICLNDCVAEVTRLVRPSIDAHIEIKMELDPRLWNVEADSGQIEQALMNLVINARDAIEGDGRIVIQSACRRLPAPTQTDNQHSTEDFVELAVIDNGCGMDRATQQRVFDPFFSTKQLGRSAGLGLAMVFGIAEHHAGSINVVSEPGEGSTFRLLIPRSKRRAEHDQGPVDEAAPHRGEETVLFVDDESPLRALGRAVLESSGHTILEAADGQEGVDAFAQHRDEIGLVVLDLTMPRKSGWEALEEIRKIKADVPVIVSSGYSIEGGAEAAIERGANAFLPKPYRAQQLLSTVLEVLAHEDSPPPKLPA